VVETEDSIMVINLDNAQDVKEVYEKIKSDEEKRGFL